MNKATLEGLVNNKLSTRDIAKESCVSQTTARYWLAKHGLATDPKYGAKSGVRRSGTSHLCKVCGETEEGKFYGRRRGMCRSCHNEETILRSRANKKFAVDYLGGKCGRCGYSKSLWALQFHHVGSKDRNSNTMLYWSRDRLTRELDKCELLCANCHLEEHEASGLESKLV